MKPAKDSAAPVRAPTREVTSRAVMADRWGGQMFSGASEKDSEAVKECLGRSASG